MTAAQIMGQEALARKMYDSLNEENSSVDFLQANFQSVHPMQFILWNMATYLNEIDKEKQANKYLNEAINLCDSIHSGATMKVIQLGMYTEKLLIARKKCNQQQIENIKKEVTKSIEYLHTVPNAKIIFEYLQNFQKIQLEDAQKLNMLVQLTRCIN